MSGTYKGSPSPPAGLPNPDLNDNLEMATQNYTSVYSPPSMLHPQETSSSHAVGSVVYPSGGNGQWQYPTQEYSSVSPGMYYPHSNQVLTPGSLPAQYSAAHPNWSAPLPSNSPHPSLGAAGQVYYPPSESTTSYGEAGASRTGRGLRRPVRDATLMGPQGDNEASGSLEANSPSTTKRTKTGNNASTPSEQKGFSCSLCSATFTRKGDCQRHMRSVHTHETPYDCQGCGEMFTRSDMRGKHWKNDPQCEKMHWRQVMTASGRANLLEPDV